MFILDSMLALVFVLLAVAFFTLMERKIMGLAHYRKGPSKILLAGMSQPIADAVKLMIKESLKISMSKYSLLTMGPTASLMVMTMAWAWYEFNYVVLSSSMKVIMLFAIMGLGIYSFLMMSWGSNSKYAILGGNRAIAQTMSYEICMFMVVMVMSYMWYSYSSTNMHTIQQGVWGGFSAPFITMVWILLCLAESNRTPFDTAEGESEIVSGFNIEYGGGMFSLIFISEYGMMLILSFLTMILFMGGTTTLLKMMLMVFMFVWTRCSFPRVRYDFLMFMSWKMMLPICLTMMTMVLLQLSI